MHGSLQRTVPQQSVHMAKIPVTLMNYPNVAFPLAVVPVGFGGARTGQQAPLRWQAIRGCVQAALLW